VRALRYDMMLSLRLSRGAARAIRYYVTMLMLRALPMLILPRARSSAIRYALLCAAQRCQRVTAERVMMQRAVFIRYAAVAQRAPR